MALPLEVCNLVVQLAVRPHPSRSHAVGQDQLLHFGHQHTQLSPLLLQLLHTRISSWEKERLQPKRTSWRLYRQLSQCLCQSLLAREILVVESKNYLLMIKGSDPFCLLLHHSGTSRVGGFCHEHERLSKPAGRDSSSCAVAVAMSDGLSAGLDLINAILARGELENYHLAHAARADLCRRLGQTTEARTSYERALALTQQEPERRFLERRLSELPG